MPLLKSGTLTFFSPGRGPRVRSPAPLSDEAWALHFALERSTGRVVDLFRKWDEDRSGCIDKREFERAIESIGFGHVERDDVDAVFDALDGDRSGRLEYAELAALLRTSEGQRAAKANIARAARPDRSRGAAGLVGRYKEGFALRPLPDFVRLDPHGGRTIQAQLVDVMRANAVRLVDLFRDWDEGGNGGIDRRELRKALAALGYDVERRYVDGFFDSIDVAKSGFIDFFEFKRALSDDGVREAERGGQGAAARELAAAAAARAGGDAEAMQRLGGVDYGETNSQRQLMAFLGRNSLKIDGLFNEWDVDRSGALDKAELARAIASLGYFASRKDVRALYDAIDENGDGHLQRAEFRKACARCAQHPLEPAWPHPQSVRGRARARARALSLTHTSAS